MEKQITLEWIKNNTQIDNCDLCALNYRLCRTGCPKGGFFGYKKRFEPVTINNTKPGDIIWYENKGREVIAIWEYKGETQVVDECCPGKIYPAHIYKREVK